MNYQSTSGNQHNTKVAAAPTLTPTPALQPVPSSPGLYLITQADSNQNSQVTKVDEKTGNVLWNHPIGTSESPVIVADDIVFGTSSDANTYGTPGASPVSSTNDHNYVYALSAKNGTQIWKTDLRADYVITASPTAIMGTPVPAQGMDMGTLGTPTFADGMLYVPASDGKIYALNAANGSSIWTYDTHTPEMDANSGTRYFTPTLAVANGVVYGAVFNKLFAINTQEGHVIWSATADPSYYFGSPTVANGSIYLSMDPLSTHTENSAQSHIVAYSADHGTQLWKSDGYYWAGFLDNAPVVTNGLVYVANLYTGIYALASQTGQTKWQKVFGTDAFNNPHGCSWPVVANGSVYSQCGTNNNPMLYAYNATSGDVIWSQPSAADPVDISNDVLYGTAFPGLVYFVDAADGATTFHQTYGVVGKDKFGDASAPEPSLKLVP
jgi:eukaryotic-like serine/threonine-protein kinase